MQKKEVWECGEDQEQKSLPARMIYADNVKKNKMVRKDKNPRQVWWMNQKEKNASVEANPKGNTRRMRRMGRFSPWKSRVDERISHGNPQKNKE